MKYALMKKYYTHTHDLQVNSLLVTLLLSVCLHTGKWFQVLLSNTNNSI